MKCKIHLQSSKLYLLEIYIHFFTKMAKKMNLTITTQMLPMHISRISLYKSPHVNKKAKDHYEIRNYKTIICLSNISNVILIKKLLINKPIEVSCKVQMVL